MLKPLENRVVLRVKEEEEKSMGGIVLTSASQEKPQTAEVVAVGEGKTNHHGTLISPLEMCIRDRSNIVQLVQFVEIITLHNLVSKFCIRNSTFHP